MSQVDFIFVPATRNVNIRPLNPFFYIDSPLPLPTVQEMQSIEREKERERAVMEIRIEAKWDLYLEHRNSSQLDACQAILTASHRAPLLLFHTQTHTRTHIHLHSLHVESLHSGKYDKTK